MADAQKSGVTQEPETTIEQSNVIELSKIDRNLPIWKSAKAWFEERPIEPDGAVFENLFKRVQANRKQKLADSKLPQDTFLLVDPIGSNIFASATVYRESLLLGDGSDRGRFWLGDIFRAQANLDQTLPRIFDTFSSSLQDYANRNGMVVTLSASTSDPEVIQSLKRCGFELNSEFEPLFGSMNGSVYRMVFHPLTLLKTTRAGVEAFLNNSRDQALARARVLDTVTWFSLIGYVAVLSLTRSLIGPLNWWTLILSILIQAVVAGCVLWKLLDLIKDSSQNRKVAEACLRMNSRALSMDDDAIANLNAYNEDQWPAFLSSEIEKLSTQRDKNAWVASLMSWVVVTATTVVSIIFEIYVFSLIYNGIETISRYLNR